MEEELQQQEIVAQPTQEQAPIDIEKIIAELKAQGLEVEAIYQALEEMLKEGEITEEDLARAKELLEAEDKELASKQFGVDIL